MQAKNKALRDPVIYRCNLIAHNRTGYVGLDFTLVAVYSLVITATSTKCTQHMTLLVLSWIVSKVSHMPFVPTNTVTETHNTSGLLRN
jgi:hypothetical protein